MLIVQVGPTSSVLTMVCEPSPRKPISCLAPCPGRDRALAYGLLAGTSDGHISLFQSVWSDDADEKGGESAPLGHHHATYGLGTGTGQMTSGGGSGAGGSGDHPRSGVDYNQDADSSRAMIMGLDGSRHHEVIARGDGFDHHRPLEHARNGLDHSSSSGRGGGGGSTSLRGSDRNLGTSDSTAPRPTSSNHFPTSYLSRV